MLCRYRYKHRYRWLVAYADTYVYRSKVRYRVDIGRVGRSKHDARMLDNLIHNVLGDLCRKYMMHVPAARPTEYEPGLEGTEGLAVGESDTAPLLRAVYVQQ